MQTERCSTQSELMHTTTAAPSSQPKKKLSRMRRSDIFWGYLCVAPLTIGLLLFLAAPLCYACYLSLTTYDLFNPPVFVKFDNFIRAFSENETQFWPSVGNAFVMCIGVLLSMAISLVLANLLSGKKKGTNVFRMIYFLPTICSSVAVGIMWKRIYDYQYGFLNQIIGLFGFEKVNWLDSAHAVPSLIFLNVIFGMGTNILLYIATIKNIPRSYYEAAELDGAGGLQKFFYITLPSVSPVSFYILTMGVIGCLQGFAIYQVMTGGSPSNTMMPVMLIYNYAGGNYGAFYGYSSTLAILLGIIIAIVTALNFGLSKKWVYYES